MRKFILLIFLFLSTVQFTQAQPVRTFNFRFSTYFYTWQLANSLNQTEKTTHARGYQNLLMEAAINRWSLNTNIQTEEDVVEKVGRGFNYRFYNLYLKGSNLFDMFDVRLGRQYIFGGVGKGSIDGGYLKIKAGKNKEYQLMGFGGLLTPYDYKFENYGKGKENYLFGGQFAYYGVRDLYAAISYMNKHRKLKSYYTLRLDSALSTKEVFIDTDTPADQLIGLDLNYTYRIVHNFFGKAYFDINLKKFYRGEVNVRVRPVENLTISADYLYREPQMSYNTIFWVFEHKQYQEIGGGADYTFKNLINIYGRASAVLYSSTGSSRENTSVKIVAGFNHPNFGLSFVRYMGYSGESDGVNGYIQREIVKSKLSASASLGYARYRLSEYETDKVNSFSGLAGFTYRPIHHFSVDAQGQFIINRIYKIDSRFMIGFSYWFFKTL
jgi:hypothetical protein